MWQDHKHLSYGASDVTFKYVNVVSAAPFDGSQTEEKLFPCKFPPDLPHILLCWQA